MVGVEKCGDQAESTEFDKTVVLRSTKKKKKKRIEDENKLVCEGKQDCLV
jgi:hypothetical protein